MSKYLLIGNKSDLKGQRAVTLDEAENLAKSIGASDYVETSAKQNKNVNLAFERLVHQILRKQGEEF